MAEYLSRDAILAAQDIETEEVAVPQWGGTVMVRGMTGTQRDAFEASVLTEEQPNRAGRRGKRAKTEFKISMVNLRAKLCVWCIVDAVGERLFTDADSVALGEKSGAAIDVIYDVASRLSGISENDMSELAEDMVTDPFDGSPSA